MGRFEITSPDGKRFEITAPEGATQEQVLSYAQQQFSVPSAPVKASTADVIAGLPVTRFAMGLASPVIAAGQLGANIGDKVVEWTGGKPVVGKAINEGLAEYEAMKKRGMEATGRSGYDWMGLLGNLAPSGKIAGEVTKALPQATSALSRIGVGGAAGAGMAAATPVSHGEDFFANKAAQTGVGATIGAAVPAVSEVLRPVVNFGKRMAEPFTEKGREAILTRFQNELLGKEPGTKDKIVQALMQAREIVPGSKPTSGEAVAHIPEATGLISHQRATSKLEGISPEFQARSMAQEAARRDALVPIARNEGALQGEKAVRDTITAPMREKALAQANMRSTSTLPTEDTIRLYRVERPPSMLPTSFDREEAKRLAEVEGRWFTPSLEKAKEFAANIGNVARIFHIDVPRSQAEQYRVSNLKDVAKYSTDAKNEVFLPRELASRKTPSSDQLKTAVELHATPPTPLKTAKELAMSGMPEQVRLPITADGLAAKIDAIGKRPGLRASDVVQKSLNDIKAKLSALANEDGRIDARDLYMVRKEAGNVIQKYAEETKNFDQRLTAGLVRDVQKHMDDAITAAGGKGWQAYLSKYQELSKPLARMEAGQEYEKALTSSLGTAERGTVFGNVGRDKPELREALLDRDRTAIDQIREELARKDLYKQMASKTNFSGAKAIHEGMQFPTMLSRPAMVANYLLRMAGQGAQDKINRLAADRYLNPSQLASALSATPPDQRSLLVEAIMKRAGVPLTVGASREF